MFFSKSGASVPVFGRLGRHVGSVSAAQDALFSARRLADEERGSAVVHTLPAAPAACGGPDSGKDRPLRPPLVHHAPSERGRHAERF